MKRKEEEERKEIEYSSFIRIRKQYHLGHRSERSKGKREKKGEGGSRREGAGGRSGRREEEGGRGERGRTSQIGDIN